MGDKKKWGKPCHIHAVRCPHCGKPNDFREVEDALGDGGDYSDKKAKPTVVCDHCAGKIEVVKVQRTVLIWARQWSGKVAATKDVSVTIQVCLLCGVEDYADGNGQFVNTTCEQLVIDPDDEHRPADEPKAAPKVCGGKLVKRTVTRQAGESQQIFKPGQRIITCPKCNQQWYDRVPLDPKTKKPTCNCGTVLG